MADDTSPSAKLKPDIPHSARIWNYWQGGKDNFAVDRTLGDEIAEANPQILQIARAQRDFLTRAVRYLAGEAGIRQFLDIGTGIPTASSTHEVAQAVAPTARVVYVDHDPLVLANARALLTSGPQGATDYIDADLREPDKIRYKAVRTLDLKKPVSLILLGITAHIVDDEEAYAIVRRLMAETVPGSYLVLCDDTEVHHPEQMAQMIAAWNASGENPRVNRTPERLLQFFDGLDLVEPGLVPVSRWRPDNLESVQDVDDYGGIGRKPH